MEDLTALAPLIALTVAGSVCLVAEPFLARWQSRMPLVFTALLGLGAAGLTCITLAGREDALVWHGALRIDDFGMAASGLILLAAALCVLGSPGYLESHRRLGGEYYALILFSAVGMLVMATAADGITLFLGIETMSLAVYVLAGYFRRDHRSIEAAIKYFVLGAFASGFLLLGLAFLYGVTGTVSLAALSGAEGLETLPARLAEVRAHPLGLTALGLVLVGLLFKVGAAPFQVWVPDVYEGAPTSVTAFMASAVKIAGFAALLRVFSAFFPIWPEQLTLLLGAVALLTLVVGHFLALVQRRVKRLLAYSSIAHTGYLLIGVLVAVQAMVLTPAPGRRLEFAGSFTSLGLLPDLEVVQEARAALLFYLLAYTFASVGFFVCLSGLRRAGKPVETLDDLSGLAVKYPAASAALVLFLISFAGIPLSAGFFGKYLVFKAAVAASDGMLPLVVAAILLALVGAAYYLRVVVFLYFRGHGLTERAERGSWDQRLTVLVCAAATLALGLYPTPVLEWLARVAENPLGG